MNNSKKNASNQNSLALRKAIKISPENRQAIEEALEKVNGRACRHCFDRYSEINAVVADAERWLADKLPKGMWKGAQVEQQSGQILAKAYSYAARTTTVRVERRASGWFLTQVTPSVLWPNSYPAEKIYLTQAQSDEIQRRVRTQYEVIKEEQPLAVAA